MNTQPVQGNNSWSQFVKLAHNAKVRNGGFDVPLTQGKAYRTAQNRNSVIKNKLSVVHSMKRLYDINTPEKQKPVLGTKFDAYA